MVAANNADPDQTAGAVWSGSPLFAILSFPILFDDLLYMNCKTKLIVSWQLWWYFRYAIFQNFYGFFYSWFFRIKKGYPYEARVIARVLPAFLADFFPPQDIMNKVIGEFLSSQQPYPQLIAKVVFQVQ